MKTRFSILAAFLAVSPIAFAANDYMDDVKMPTEHNLGTKHSDLSTNDRGFFFAAEAKVGYSMLPESDKKLGMTAIDLTAGYRISDYLRVGAGFGPRIHFDNRYDKKGYDGKYRSAAHNMSMALYVNARGNFMPSDYRTIVPYWSVNVGGTMPDGMFVSPTLGIRVGEKRSAFLLGLSYMMQEIRQVKMISSTEFTQDRVKSIDRKATSFLMLSLGYEF